MSDILRMILALTLSGSCMAAVAALVGRVCRRWAPRRFAYFLWLPVLISFLIPLGTRHSLIPRLEQSGTEAELILNLGEPTQLDGWDMQIQNGGKTAFVPMREGKIALQDIPLEKCAFYLWLCGAALALGWLAASYWRFRRRITACAQMPEKWEQELLNTLTPAGKRPKLRRCAGTVGPCLLGVWNSTLILPEHSYRPDILQDILEHELCHWRRRDLAVKWLAALATCVHWFNPLCWWMAGRLDRDCELACDEQVLARQGQEQRVHYGRTLILVAADSASTGYGLTACMYTQKQRLKERLEYLMKEKKRGRHITAALCIAALVVALSTTVFGAYLGGGQTEGTAENRDMVQTVDGEGQGAAAPAAQPEQEDLAPEQGEQNTDEFCLPVQLDKIVLSMLYGSRIHPITGKSQDHDGIDIVADRGTEVLASKGGVVVASSFESTYGNYVVISHGGEQSTLYAHLSQRNVSQGDTVDRGQVIGLVGSTGQATGAHLHFEVWKDGSHVDPLSVLNVERVYVRANGEEAEYQIQ